jgi:hypothetical protein
MSRVEKDRNNVTAIERSSLRGDPFGAFDQLPQEVRRVLHSAVINLDSLWAQREIIRGMKDGLTVEAVARMIIQVVEYLEDSEIKGFAQHWPVQFGVYPHIAARATILRYDRGWVRND